MLAGTPREMGEEHGELLRDEITLSMTHFLRKSEEIFDVPYDFLMREARRCEVHIPEVYLEELKYVAYASGIDYDELLAYNCLADVDAFFERTVHHCCNFILTSSATENGELMHGRNLDFPLDRQVQEAVSVCISRCPDSGLNNLSVTTAGCVGTYTGMSQTKISVAEVVSPHGTGSPDGVPVSFLLRSILDHASSLDEAFEMVEKHERTCGFNLALSDGKTGQAMCIEYTHDVCAHRGPHDGVLVVDNPCLTPKAARNRLTYAAGTFRFCRMMQLIRENRAHLNEQTVLDILKDRFDVVSGYSLGNSYNCICNYHTMQSVLMFPEQLTLLASLSEIPAPLGKYGRVALVDLWGL